MGTDDFVGDAGSTGVKAPAAYRLLPLNPPVDNGNLDQVEHAAELPPPDLLPSRYSRVRMVTGGVLTLASLVVMVGLVWWAIGREDRAEGAQAIQDTGSPSVPPDAESPDRGVLPGGADDEFFADPDGFVDRFREEFPDGLTDEDPLHPPGGEFDFSVPDGQFDGGIGSRFGRLQEELDSMGIPSLDLVLPDDAIVRGFTFSSVGEGEERSLGLTVTFELDEVRSRLTASSSGEIGDGTPVDLDGTPGILDESGRLVWKAGGGTITFTLESQDLDEETLLELGVEIERAMR